MGVQFYKKPVVKSEKGATAPRLKDHYSDVRDFQMFLSWALQRTQTVTANEFLHQAKAAFSYYGAEMFWSYKQNAWLLSLADGGAKFTKGEDPDVLKNGAVNCTDDK